MKLKPIKIVLLLASFLIPGSGFAEGEKILVDKEVFERMQASIEILMKEREQHQKEREQHQKAVDEAREAAELAAKSAHEAKESIRRESYKADAGPGWFDNVEVFGLTEVEVGYNDPDSGDANSDIVLATQEIGVAAQVNDWV